MVDLFRIRMDELICKRLEQTCSSLISEGYYVIGRVNSSVALRHMRNGNRITLTVIDGCIATIKNGRLVKTELPTASRNKPEVVQQEN